MIAKIVCDFLQYTNRRDKRSIKRWVSNQTLKRVTARHEIDRFIKRTEALYAQLTGRHDCDQDSEYSRRR